MNAAEIRESFLKFFETQKHQRFKSGALIPQNDPTLFFTNAGMVPFKNVFTGQEDVGTSRATSSQKCMRVSGKHNDLENVGRTHRHHTFFEMLGNFSFGDYFKKEAIQFAWEYLTEVLKIDKSKLWVTVFREDDEAEELWLQVTDVPKDRILRMDEADNFWSMGATGPCGPCTEIHFDHGAAAGCDRADCAVGCDCDRYMEIWNLVFMQFNRSEDGAQAPLPKPSVDTGMGLERLACVIQGVHSNYDTDLFQPILQQAAKLAGVKYGADDKADVSLRVLADHLRASCFLLADGVFPSNEGRGYVLRRIMRRAIRHGRLLGFREPFFYQLVPVLNQLMSGAYPELTQNEKLITEAIRAEEVRFLETVEKGLDILETEIKNLKAAKKKKISGKVAFKLYDTFGFPLDLSQNIAEEAGLQVDQAAFEKLMEGQRAQARKAWKGSGESARSEVHQQLLSDGKTSEFLGYDGLSATSKIIAMVLDGKEVQEAKLGESVEIFTEQTPFYGESGGQVGDQGRISTKSFDALVKDTMIPVPGLISHHAKIQKGTIQIGDLVELKVNLETRAPTQLNHSATHLLHAALRKVLGEQVKQAGSLVGPNRLRFDFSHFKAMSVEEIRTVEDLVNEKIRANFEVQKKILSYDQAMEEGAMALFGEKYGDEVRVLKMGDFSTELCGGTHVERTGDIGVFKILSEASAAAGVRRIEALTGADALQHLQKLENNFQQLAHQFKVTPEAVVERVQKQSETLKKLQTELSQLKTQVAISGSGESSDPLAQVQEVAGIKLLAIRRDMDDVKLIRELSDQFLNKLKSGICVMASVSKGKASLIVRVSKDLTERFSAGDIVKELAQYVEGSGGGRADMAQAGGSNIDGIETVLAKAAGVVESLGK